ncbi:DUF4936 family protein [Pigmentiphaga sp. GD03639]|uniref:DUF4936 domain-containing protein n=1 Tax=Pigmentiphaga daeguensis TaxID=414049 RepID=A0ABN1B9K9_9BURK|nr:MULTISPECIES: DUF4936 family protein [unclassified Pigmentiphaga]MDH2235562.1 DUF4936 family protein [Pigmentiphaga sp. GD03639]
MHNLYVYYKLPQARRAEALAPARRVLEAGRARSARAALLARPAADDGVVTWMEVYEDVADVPGLEAALAEAVQASGLAALLLAPRRSEVFVDLPADPAGWED